MARTSVIKQNGTGDYTSVQAWETSINLTTNGLETGEIQDTNTYTPMTFSGFTGTPSISEYAYLTVHPDHRHDGTFDVGARIAGGPGHVITNNEDFTRIEYLRIRQTGTGSSDEGIRCNADTLVSRCLLDASTVTSSQDGVYMATSGVTMIVDHCIVKGFERSGIHAQLQSNMIMHVDHCAVVQSDAQAIGGSAGGSMELYVYNTFAHARNQPADSGAIGESPGGHSANTNYTVLQGDRVAASDDSAENKFTNSYDNFNFISVEPSSGENIWVVDEGGDDFRIFDTNDFTISQNGQSRTPPDSRQDFSIDLTGRSWGALTQIGPNVPTQQSVDSTAPVLTSPTVANIQHTTVEGGVETDENNGTLYWIVDQSNTAPSVAQIQAGQGSDSVAADGFGNQGVSSLGQQEVVVADLSPDTSYYMYFQHQDAANNDSTVVGTTQFTTELLGIADIAGEGEQGLSVGIGLVLIPFVVMQCTDALGGDIPNQSNVSTWIYTDRDLAPDVTTANSSIQSGELKINVDGTLANGEQVHVIAELQNGFLAVGNTVVTES